MKESSWQFSTPSPPLHFILDNSHTAKTKTGRFKTKTKTAGFETKIETKTARFKTKTTKKRPRVVSRPRPRCRGQQHCFEVNGAKPNCYLNCQQIKLTFLQPRNFILMENVGEYSSRIREDWKLRREVVLGSTLDEGLRGVLEVYTTPLGGPLCVYGGGVEVGNR